VPVLRGEKLEVGGETGRHGERGNAKEERKRSAVASPGRWPALAPARDDEKKRVGGEGQTVEGEEERHPAAGRTAASPTCGEEARR
jgi:hypothetical protein